MRAGRFILLALFVFQKDSNFARKKLMIQNQTKFNIYPSPDANNHPA